MLGIVSSLPPFSLNLKGIQLLKETQVFNCRLFPVLFSYLVYKFTKPASKAFVEDRSASN